MVLDNDVISWLFMLTIQLPRQLNSLTPDGLATN